MPAEVGVLDRWFGLTRAGTTVRTEVLGGLTTFLTMAYILFVQPAFLGAAGMDPGAVLTATCISSAVAAFVMGIWANYPVGLAPGMGLNAFFSFTVCLKLGIPWQEALGLVVTSGVLFISLTLVGLRERLVEVVPHGLRHGIAAGIGLFIALIGLKEAGFLIPDPDTLVGVGDLSARWPMVLTAGCGFFVAAVGTVRRWPAAIVIGIGTSLAVGLLVGVTEWHGVVARPPSLAPTAFHVSFARLLTFDHLGLVLLFLYTDLFDTVGTLMGVATHAGLMEDDKLPRANRAFLADAIGTLTGGLLGTSTVTSYIESTAGVEAGARTGLAAVVVGLGFLGALFLYPLVQTVGGGVPVEVPLVTSAGPTVHTLVLHPITAPALLLVGALMARSLVEIRWKEPAEAIAAFLVVAGIPFTFSIADGISLGLIAWSLMTVASGRARESSPFLHAVAALLALRWIGALAGWG